MFLLKGLRAAAFAAAVLSAAPAVSQLTYGVHYPDGKAAVDFMYSPDGNFKPLAPLEYPYNFYAPAEYNNSCDSSGVPTDRSALIAYSNGPRKTTTPDKDCHLLFDLNGDGELDGVVGGSAFIEHNGVDSTGAKTSTEFNNFWFDDNWLARYMSAVYARPQPTGLWAPSDYNRWAIIGGDTSNWSQNLNPWGTGFFDHLSFRGLYNLITSSCLQGSNSATAEWVNWINQSGAAYNDQDQRFDYPNVNEDYYYGFFLILTQKMIDAPDCSPLRHFLTQHAVSLRSQILSRQIKNGSGTRLGWVTNRNDPQTLINTETTALNVLGLGAGGRYAFEPGRAPMFKGPGNYFLRHHNALSAVRFHSSPGMMNFGPYVNFPTGQMDVEFHMRSPGATGLVATVDIYDANWGIILSSQQVFANRFTGNDWIKFPLSAQVYNPNNNLEFRVYWHGTSNLDLAHIQVK